MAEVEWIKLYLKTFRTSRKISAIEQMKNGDTIIVIWFKLLFLAGEINDGGTIYITPQKPFDVTSLAYEIRRPKAIVETAMKVFEEHGMIFKDDAGFIQIVNWEKYQSVDRLSEIRAQTRERVAKCRKNKKAKQDGTDVVTPCNVTSNADVTPCNDIEEDEEKDKEFHSFIHSIAREENEDDVSKRDKDRVKREFMGGTLGAGVVMLSEAEIDQLLEDLSLDEFNYYVGVVRDCELSGQKYRKKTHYKAIMDMVNKDRKIK